MAATQAGRAARAIWRVGSPVLAVLKRDPEGLADVTLSAARRFARFVVELSLEDRPRPVVMLFMTFATVALVQRVLGRDFLGTRE